MHGHTNIVFIGYLFSCFCFFFPSLCLPLISVANQWHCSFLFLSVAIIRSVTEVISAPLDKGKGKDIPIRAWTGPNSCRRLRLPDFLDNLRHIARKGGKVVSPTYRPPFPPRRHPWYSFLLSGWAYPRAIVRLERVNLVKHFSDPIGNRIRELPAYCAVPQSTATAYAVPSGCPQLFQV